MGISQLYFWTAHWQAGEREAESDIAAGRVRDFDDPDDAIHWLLSPHTDEDK